VKIERFTKDESVVIKNTMTYTDSYDDITPEQLHIFTNMGWEAGVVMVNIQTNDKKVEYYNCLMRHAILDNDTAQIDNVLRKREELLKKNVDFRLEFNKLLSTL
jgi:phosphopantetheine adenylyltransferase